MGEPFKAEKRSGVIGGIFLAFFFILISILSIGLIVAVWPKAEGTPSWLGTVSSETKYLLLVICGGAVGSLLNAFRSIMQLIGDRAPLKGWLLWYALRVLVGIPVALVSYLVIRGGLLSPQAVSIIIGTSATQVLDRLDATFTTLFKPEASLEKDISRIGEALGVATLGNYSGFLCLSFQDALEKAAALSKDGRPVLPPKAACGLTVWFQPDKPQEVLADEIQIAGGTDVKSVIFQLVPDSDSIRLRPPQESLSFAVKEASRRVTFQFQTPESFGPYEIWLTIFQKGRLIHVMQVTVDVLAQRMSDE